MRDFLTRFGDAALARAIAVLDRLGDTIRSGGPRLESARLRAGLVVWGTRARLRRARVRLADRGRVVYTAPPAASYGEAVRAFRDIDPRPRPWA